MFITFETLRLFKKLKSVKCLNFTLKYEEKKKTRYSRWPLSPIFTFGYQFFVIRACTFSDMNALSELLRTHYLMSKIRQGVF